MKAGLWQRFEAIANSRKTSNLFGDIDGCWTREDSLTAVYAIAAKIEELVGPSAPDCIIAIHLPRDRRYLASMFAVWMRGSPMLPLNTAWPQSYIDHILSHSKASVLITLDSESDRDFGNAKVIRLPDTDKITSLPAPCSEYLESWETTRAQQELAYIIYTSGSTGEQKGVSISHQAFNAYTAWTHHYWSNQEYSALLITAELTFDLSLGDIAFALAHDVEIHLSPQPGNIFAHAYLLRDRKIDILYSVPSTLSRLFRLCRDREDIYTDRLKLVVAGGDVLSPKLVSEVKELAPYAEFHNVYGPTEMTINCMATRVDDLLIRIESMNLVPIGHPFEHLETLLHPEMPGDIEGWVKGELLVGGVQSMSGYHQDLARTKEVFIVLNGKRYYRTGDLVARDPGGLHYFLSRMDSLVKVNGYRVNPVTIDNLLLTETAVTECKTVSINDESGVARLLTFAVASASLDPKHLMKRCRDALPDYACPDRIIFMPELPLGRSGKYDLRELQAIAQEHRFH